MPLCDRAALAAVRAWLLTGRPPEGERPAPEELVAAAGEQGLSGLLDASAARCGMALPLALAQPLRRAHYAALARAERQLATARKVAALLAEQGLRSLPLKGAAVAEWLYDSPAERPMGDVDILALDDWQRSRQLLEQAGYVEQERADHARSYLAPESGVVVELHHSLTSCPGLFPLDREGLWSRRRRGAGGALPSAADTLVQLGLHAAFQHGLGLRLVQYMDLRRLLERAPPDTSLVVEIARHAGASAALALALESAALVVEAPVPDELRLALRPALSPGLQRWLEAFRSEPLGLVDPPRPPLLRLRWALAAGRRVRLMAGTLDGREPGESRPAGRGLLRGIRRAGLLARRWGPRPGA